jgi:hypothetical protein
VRALSLLIVVFSLGACVVEPCKRGELLSTSFPQRHAACIAQDTLPGPTFDVKACTTSMKVCSATDELALQKYFDCVEQLPVCTPETRTAFNDKFLACASGMNRLSAGCFVP